MTLREFIKRNRVDIDDYIGNLGIDMRINDDERRLWILNEETLYLWAKREGVKGI